MGHSEGPHNQQPVISGDKCDNVEIKCFVCLKCSYNSGSSARARQINTLVATLANIEELKPEQEECGKLLIKSKDIVALQPTGFEKSLIYQL